jgi:NAD-specific glutamate dehydrogenase
LRFRDVARGGIRIVSSRNKEYVTIFGSVERSKFLIVTLVCSGAQKLLYQSEDAVSSTSSFYFGTSVWIPVPLTVPRRFDENYGLANTQSLKNKDIPEGGAKGTILPSLGAPPRLCFEKYVDVRSFRSS